MTDRAPIPAEVFDDALDRMDRDVLAGFVGRLEAATDGDAAVEVDPPIVTVGDGDDRERLLVAPGGSDRNGSHSDGTAPVPDAVVVPDGSSATDPEIPVRTTEDLRQQLLYAVSPEAAASIAEEWLGVPARSASYAPEPTTAATDHDTSDIDAAGSPPTSGGSDEAPAPESAEPTPDATPKEPDGSQESATGDERVASGAPTTRAGLVVVGVLVVMILAVAGGVVYAAEVSPDGDAGAFASSAPIDDAGLSDAEIRRESRDFIDESGAITTTTPLPGEDHGSEAIPDGATEADRNVRPVPTCERSFLHVVQIQMNALKYNNNTTDDGIRTVRRFASPQNRRSIQTFDDFVRVIKSSTYSPMLSHDSAQYTPIQSSGDFAQVQVTTRADGNVTGQYHFRLRKVDGGEYDGCWMTDAVVSVPETSDFSGKVAGQRTGSVNGTS